MKELTLTLAIALGLLTQSSTAAEPIHCDGYEQAIKNADRNVLVVFGTDWCSHCVRLKKDIKSLNLDDYVVCVVDADENKEIARKNKVSSYPTSVIFSEGKEIARKKGYTKGDYQGWLDSNRKEPKKDAQNKEKKPAEQKRSCCGCGCDTSKKCECTAFCSCWWSSVFGMGGCSCK